MRFTYSERRQAYYWRNTEFVVSDKDLLQYPQALHDFKMMVVAEHERRSGYDQDTIMEAEAA